MTIAPWVGVWAAKRHLLLLLALAWAVTGIANYVLDPELGLWAIPRFFTPLAIVPLAVQLVEWRGTPLRNPRS
jgi:hypothetical protein